MKHKELSQAMQKQIRTLNGFGVSKNSNVTFNGKLITLERIKKILKWNEKFGGLNKPPTIRIEIGGE